MKISEWTWKSFDGLDMYGCGWAPEGQPKAVIVLVHGLGEHCGWYAHIGAMLAEKGYALLGFDLRGHGKSGGSRGHTPSFEAFMKVSIRCLSRRRLGILESANLFMATAWEASWC